MGKKIGNPGNIGKVAVGKKAAPGKTTVNKALDKVTMKSAMGILTKHFPGVK